MTSRTILIIGGSGLIGSAIAAKLCAQGKRVIVPTRRRERAKHLILLPTADVIETDVTQPGVLAGLMHGVDAVINLAGRLHSDTGTPYGRRFRAVHVDLARKVAEACVTAGVPRLLHMSSLCADTNGPSMYLRSKADGETAVRDAVTANAAVGAGANSGASAARGAQPTALTIFRTSVVFGRNDKFINLFAWMQKFAPFVLLGKPEAKLQPVWVEDVAQAFVNALDEPRTFGRAYDLAGPKVYTLKQLVEYAGAVSGNPRKVFGLPDGLAYLQAWSMEFAPVEMLSRDNLDSTKVDNVMPAPIAPELGVTPAAMEAVVPAYLSGKSPKERYMQFRDHARR
jgi:uncharacterized protein YbjT (DUF2867 family)